MVLNVHVILKTLPAVYKYTALLKGYVDFFRYPECKNLSEEYQYHTCALVS